MAVTRPYFYRRFFWDENGLPCAFDPAIHAAMIAKVSLEIGSRDPKRIRDHISQGAVEEMVEKMVASLRELEGTHHGHS